MLKSQWTGYGMSIGYLTILCYEHRFAVLIRALLCGANNNTIHALHRQIVVQTFIENPYNNLQLFTDKCSNSKDNFHMSEIQL